MSRLSTKIAALLVAALTLPAYANETRYVSDELQAYVHSGPSTQYRILGTLNAGDTVTLNSVNVATGFAQVTDSKGRQVWLPENQLSTSPSLRVRVPELEAQVKELTAKLSTIDADWQQRTRDMQAKVNRSDSDMAVLQGENERLKADLQQAKDKIQTLNTHLDSEKREILMRWFIYGGGVAGAGLLLGLLLPHLIPTRRRKDRWMR
ncbi:MAG: TIGR04211 family SH3 domain-containing protein [Plesiomonas sp.]